MNEKQRRLNLNKEFRRRTKIMEIVVGEIACCRILAYIFFDNYNVMLV